MCTKESQTCSNNHFYMASLGFIASLPLPLKILGPTLIYLGLLAILDSHINICLGVPNTYVALKQFNLLQHQFEAITLG